MERKGATMCTELRACFLLVLCVCLPCLAQKQTTSQGEATVRGSVEKAAASWNAGDATGLARIWAEDGDLIDVAANQTKGRAAIEKRFADALGGPFKGSLMALHVDSVRFLNSGVAVIDGHFEISGGHRADGSELFAEKGLFTDVVVKKYGKWAVACHREMVPISSGISTIR
jgi:uncharacterized protein (TIGR02246 family)